MKWGGKPSASLSQFSAAHFFVVEEQCMLIYKALYFPVLLSCCLPTVGYVIYWILNGGDIDLGPPNARVGKPAA